MEERQLQNLKLEEQVDDLTGIFNNLDEEDSKKVLLAINLLLFTKGVVDGSFETDEKLYHFIKNNSNLIDKYLELMGLSLYMNDDYRIAWVDVKSSEEGFSYSPYIRRPMSANQLILLGVLHKRFSTKDSSSTIGIEDPTSVLLTEVDILKDMIPYMKESDNDAKKRDNALSAIKVFCNELGLLRLMWNNRELTDGTVSKVYRISPFIGCQFNIEEMNKIIASVKVANEVEDTEEETEEEMENE